MSAREIQVNELADFCSSLASEIMKEHEKRFAERMKAAKEASSRLDSAAARLASGIRNAWGSMDKTTSEYGMRLAQTIQESSQHIANEETASRYEGAEKFHEDSVESLNKIIITIRRYAPKLHRKLKPEIAALNSSLARLESSIRTLGISLDESPGSSIQTLLMDVQQIVMQQDSLLKLKSQEQEQQLAVDAASNREKEALSEKQALLSRHEFLELKRYENSLRLKEEEIRAFLQPLTKPLLKLERATSNLKNGPSVDTRTLRGLIETPVETIVTGQPFANMELLRALDEMLKQGVLEIDEKRRRRAEETMRAAREGALDEMRADYSTLQVNVQETLRQLKSSGLLEERNRLDELLAERRSQLEDLTKKQGELQRRIETLRKSILKQKSSIENQIAKLAHQSILVLAG